MKRHGFRLFDSYVTSGTTPVFSSTRHMKPLASGRQVGIVARCTEVQGTTPTLTVDLQHSADGKNFGSKYTTNLNGVWVPVPLINQFQLYYSFNPPPGPVVFSAWGAEPSARPFLEYARLAVTISGGEARVEIHASVRGSNDLELVDEPAPEKHPPGTALRHDIAMNELRGLAQQTTAMEPVSRAAHLLRNMSPATREHLRTVNQRFAAMPPDTRRGMIEGMKQMMHHARAAAGQMKPAGSCCADQPAPSGAPKQGCGCG